MTLVGCHPTPEPKFRVLSAEQTGLHFVNSLKPTPDLNIFNYMYFYNGGGVGAGDFNKDGLIDIFFTGNQVPNQLFLNKGRLQFEDVTKAAFAPSPRAGGAWSTGVSVVDINQDGLLDIYVSCVGNFLGLQGHNLLFICKEIDKKGIPHFEEKSKEYGLDLVGFGTQAAFFDFDLDGDLDLYQLNHSVHQNGTFGKRDIFLNTFHPLAGDRFFENKAPKPPKGDTKTVFFEEITQKIGINSSVVGYGLGLGLGDVNWDGYPDVYVGNDFHENDYLYINQQNGTYRDELQTRIRHTSRFTMGVDIADLNNDLLPEIFTLDMLPYDPQILKRSEGEDAYYNFKFKLTQGYNVQFARNNLQLNVGKGQFSEIGMYAGVHATDWSWSSLLFDFENDGKKDIFISNGINKRMNDMDYINFVSGDEIQQKIAEKRFDESDESLVDLLPEVKIPNKFYTNGTDLAFEDQAERIEGNLPSYSNGAIYADLDNDGDLDVVTNNINDKAFVYENLTNNATAKSLTINLKGAVGNLNAIGAKCLVYTPDGVQLQEKFPVRGFQSSAETPLLFGLGATTRIDSVVVIWPDNRFETFKNPPLGKTLTVGYKSNLPKYDYQKRTIPDAGFSDIAAEVGLDLKHDENLFNEFDREALIPNMMSTEGPALAVGDVNGDGLDDVFMGGSRGVSGRIMTQTTAGKFVELSQPSLQEDADFEDIDAVFADVNGDKYTDLIVGSGGNEYFGKSPFLKPRLYLNDGKGVFLKSPAAFGETVINAQVVRVADVNADGFPDVFVGARSVPFAYGTAPESYLFVNDGKGRFQDQTDAYNPDLKKGGMVKDAQWTDIDADRDLDLVVAYDWGKI
ncbi:MAG: VCBS repeat-containing protein, partial [Spirosomaceae bacterium]|nr:VCBS repeat-containing protein [Spirosomataceae bacterium]